MDTVKRLRLALKDSKLAQKPLSSPEDTGGALKLEQLRGRK
jgi:hypothetical protein